MSEVAIPSRTPLGIYTHIEKTAGISVRDALKNAVGIQGLYLYSPTERHFACAEDGKLNTSPILSKVVAIGLSNRGIRPLLVGQYPRLHRIATRHMRARASEEIPSGASVVMGHFIADQFNGTLEERPVVRAITVREPVSRLVSHYDDWRRLGGQHDWRVKIPYDPAMTFKDFATLPEIRNYQLQALGGLGLEDFDVVGVSERVDQSVGKFLGLLAEAGTIPSVTGLEEVHLSRQNYTPRNRKTNLESLGASALQSICMYHAEDIALYAQARAISLE